MIINTNNKGYFNENDICLHLNKTRVKDLNTSLKRSMEVIFGPLKDRKRFKCKKVEDFLKPDLAITYEKVTHYVSVKLLKATELHHEQIRTFILFLRGLGISTETQKTILYFQYGDGTLDGTGVKRMNYHDTYEWLRERIRKANEELNSSNKFIQKVVERLLFQGVVPTSQSADFLFVGDVELSTVVSRSQIERYLQSKTWNYLENLHIGPVLFRPHARYSDREIANERNHNTIVAYWPKLTEDVQFIFRHFMSDSNRYRYKK